MSPFERVLKEAHRRGLWQVLVVYAGGGWGVLGVLDTLIGYGYVPEWVFGGGLLALLVGLPVVSATAWIQGGRRVRPPATSGDPEDEAILARAEAGADAVHADMGGFDAVDVFTWPRAITGGVLAFALLGILSAGYMVMRATGVGTPGTLMAQGVLERGARVVLADFESSAGEAAPGDLLTESLRIDLGQSDAVRLVAEGDVRTALSRMRRDPADPITEEVALEIAEREGASAVIAGEVGRVGSGFTINARVISTTSAEPLAQFRVTADGEDELLDAIDELARAMRDKIGESLRSIAGTESLRAVSTSSIEALRKFTAASSGLDRGVISAPIGQQLFQEAVALDSTFAGAHRALAIAIFNYGGDRELMNASSEAAYRHRGRLPERERLATEAFYHRFSGDRAEAARAYRAMLVLNPTSAGATANLTDILIYQGAYEEAIEVSEAVPAWDRSAWAFNYMVALAAVGQFAAADAVNDSLEALVPDDPYHAWRDIMLRAATGQPALALVAADEAPPIGDPVAYAYQQYATAVANLGAGRLRTAQELLDGSLRDVKTFTGPANAFVGGLMRPWAALFVRSDRAAGREAMEEHMRDVGWDALSHFNRDYPSVALFYALAGVPNEAEQLLDVFDDQVRSTADPAMVGRARLAREAVAVQRGEDGALRRFDDALPGIECARCADLLGAFVHEDVGDDPAAIERYEAYVDQPFFDGGNVLLHLPAASVHERLGRLYEQAGNTDAAVEHYLRFAELWADADPDLQSRVQSARARAEVLSRAP